MELDVRINNTSISIAIGEPYRPDIAAMTEQIARFAEEQGTPVNGLDLSGLLPRMIRGVVGCEEGCPANAKELVERGYRDFDLKYVEGGILTATAKIAGGSALALKLFPDF